MNDPKDFLEEAESLVKGARANEVRRRSVISRAYYGCHHAAQQIAQQKGYVFDRQAGQGMHKQLNIFLDTAFQDDDNIHDAVRELNRLSQQRVRADYKLDKTIFFEDAEDSVKRAQEVMEVFSGD